MIEKRPILNAVKSMILPSNISIKHPKKGCVEAVKDIVYFWLESKGCLGACKQKRGFVCPQRISCTRVCPHVLMDVHL